MHSPTAKRPIGADNWYTSTHPDTLFVTELLAARPVSDRHYALHNNQFTVHHLNGSTERHILTNTGEMRQVTCFHEMTAQAKKVMHLAVN